MFISYCNKFQLKWEIASIKLLFIFTWLFLGYLSHPGVTNITVFTAAKRNKVSLFDFPNTRNYGLSDSTYSLLKFHQPDDDLSLDCLAANISTTLKYILVFPVKCNSNIADYFQCFSMLPSTEINISYSYSGRNYSKCFSNCQC